jgi:hypothetical protein
LRGRYSGNGDLGSLLYIQWKAGTSVYFLIVIINRPRELWSTLRKLYILKSRNGVNRTAKETVVGNYTLSMPSLSNQMKRKDVLMIVMVARVRIWARGS